MKSYTLFRVGFIVLLLALLAPVAAGMVGEPDSQSSGTDFGGRSDVLFVSTQGTATFEGKRSAVRAVDTTNGTVLWSHGSYERYFDVEALNQREVLFLGADGPHGDNMWANVVNWRTSERVTRFRVPNDTHDVDALGDGRFAVADKEDHQLYVYDAESETVVWKYDYRDHYPPSAGGDEDFTHVNDIDDVANGSLFLASPRNFDRVMLVNRSTKEPVWTLGAEDDYDVLHEQHNPTLLTRDPPTVLVADSENDRIVEYRKTGDNWTQVWAYRGSLAWPRDADRLPNGNTLVVDTANQRVLEVTPGREVVWEYTVTKQPYDADFLSLGEEPRGPSMTEFRDQFDGPEALTERESGVLSRLRDTVELLQWIAPWAVSVADFLLLLSTVGVGVFWTGFEASVRGRPRVGDLRWSIPSGTGACTVGFLAVAGWLFAAPNVDLHSESMWHGIAGLLTAVGLLSVPDHWLETGALASVDSTLNGHTRPFVAAVAVAVTLALAATTHMNAFYLAAGALLTIEGLRAVSTPSPASDAHRWFVAAGYAVRLGGFLPVVALLYVSRAPSLTAVYLALGVVTFGAMILPHVASESRAPGAPLREHVGAGARTVALVLSVATVAGLLYNLSRPTTLAGVYVGLIALLLRNVYSLVRA
jgi:outer membrane protein assembly factor BamB